MSPNFLMIPLSNGSSLFKREPFILREVYFWGDSNTAPMTNSVSIASFLINISYFYLKFQRRESMCARDAREFAKISCHLTILIFLQNFRYLKALEILKKIHDRLKSRRLSGKYFFEE